MSGKEPGRLPMPGRVRGWARGLWPDHNPLRRVTDRVEAAMTATLLMIFLIGAPLAALSAWQWAAGVGARTQQAQHPRYQVPAVLLADASYNDYAWTQTQVRARWTAPDGTTHTGSVSAPVGLHRGSTVKIWTDRAGRVLAPPLRQDQVTSQAALAAVVAPMLLSFVLMTAWTLTRRVLDRRRLAGWDADWRATGPQWTRQR